VDNSQSFILGHVETGPDAEKLHRMMELRRHFGDCANCTALKTCDICYARIPESDHAASGFDPLFDLQCQRTRDATASMLKIYTEIMEKNPAAFDWATDPPPSRTDSLRYGVIPKPLTEEELGKMGCEKL
jgi:hypothetical protein